MILLLILSLLCVCIGGFAYSAGHVLVSFVLWIISLLLVLTVLILVLADIFNKNSIIEVRD